MLNNEGKSLTIFTEGILLAIVPVAAYSLTFAFEAGYFKYFGIPLNLIQINSQIVFIAIASLSFVLFTIFLVANFISIYWPSHRALQIKLIRLLLVTIPLIWFFLIHGRMLRHWEVFVGIVGLVVLVEFVLPIFKFRNKKSYLEKLSESEISANKEPSKHLCSRLFNYLGTFGTAFVIAVLMGSFMSYDLGQAQATAQKEYLTVGESSNIVVLQVYNDMFICAPFNRDTKEIAPKFFFKKLGEDPNLMFVREKIGPLKSTFLNTQ